MVEHQGLQLLAVGSRFTIRFKKLNAYLRPANILTLQQLQIGQQEPIDGLGGVHLVAGYVLADDGLSIERCALVLLHHDEVVWVIDLDDHGQVLGLPRPGSPASPTGPSPEPRLPLIVPRTEEGRAGSDAR